MTKKKDVLIAKNNLLNVEHKSTVIIGVAHSCDVK